MGGLLVTVWFLPMWEVSHTYVGSYMYVFTCTTRTEVKVIYILNFHNFSFIK